MASGTAAPVASFTVPVMAPKTSCAGMGARSTKAAMNAKKRTCLKQRVGELIRLLLATLLQPRLKRRAEGPSPPMPNLILVLPR